MLKYLRIAVTALSLTACVLLIALWVRSYYWIDLLGGSVSDTRMILFRSEWGQLVMQLPHDEHYWSWRLRSTSAAEAAVRRHKEMLALQSIGSTVEYPGPFHFEWTDQVLQLWTPHWFLILLSTTLTVIVWLPWSKRFSLRTLLIATTLVAVVMGVIIWAAE